MSTKDSRYRVGWDVLYPPLISPNPIPAGKKTITQNGTNIDIAEYATADVNVQPNVDSKEITTNGDYIASNENLDGYSSVHVAVPSSATGTIEITQNGISDVSSYANADVEVPPPSFMKNPIEFDYNKGYVDKTAEDNLGIFVYQYPTNCYSDIYTIENGKTYHIMYGETTSTRARGCLTQTDIRTLQPGESTSGEATMVGIYGGSTVNPGSSWNFTAPFDGYFIMQKTNYGVTGILTYLYCIDDMNAAVPSGTKNITENGQGINVAGYSAVNVNVSATPTGTIQITQNGTGIDVSQYQYADVEVPGIVPTGTLNISTDGAYDVTNYASVAVNTGGSGGLPSNWSIITVNISTDTAEFTVPYDSTKTVRMIQVIPNTLQGAVYEMTYIEGKTNILTGEFNQVYSTGINYNGSAENQFQNTNGGSFTFDSTNELITIAGKGGNYKFKNGDSFTVLIVYVE